jgi:hypothetical protein
MESEWGRGLEPTVVLAVCLVVLAGLLDVGLYAGTLF